MDYLCISINFKIMRACLISIGDEILIGQITNTNTVWLAKELNLLGIRVAKMLTISDEKEAIESVLKDCIGNYELILMTGGLGPTKDDITKKTLADFFNMEMEYHEPSFNNIVSIFQKFGKYPDDRYKVQAYMPTGADILINKAGTASGMWFDYNNSIIVSMPGVPKEMMYLMQREVFPKLKEDKKLVSIEHRTISCFGIGETDLSEILDDFETNLPEYIKLAYLPNTTTGYIRLRLSGFENDKRKLNQEIDNQLDKLKNILGSIVVGEEDQKIEEIIAHKFTDKGFSLGTAESCTGGNIAHKITSIPGSSKFYMGTVVSYSNEIKTNILKVNESTLEKHGAVSEETVIEMASGLKKLLHVDYAIATSGIAGPHGGTEEKPVGTIWIAIAGPKSIETKKLQLGNDRTRNIEMTSSIALNLLRLFIDK
jgi:nicotinamide-nucleotide amidase